MLMLMLILKIMLTTIYIYIYIINIINDIRIARRAFDAAPRRRGP